MTDTVVLGFDALSERYLEAFELPNFQRLRREGAFATLESTFPPWTGSAWPSAYTGVGPAHHGVYSFFDFAGYPGDAELVTRQDVQAPALWNYCDAEGLSTAVLNVPVTHPAEATDGVLVPGYLAPEDAPGHPPGIREELAETLGEPYRIYAPEETGSGEQTLQAYLDLIALRKRAALALLERDPDLAFFQVQKTDTVFHQFDDREAFRRVYEAADHLLGAVLDAVGEANVLVCSDHGIGPTTGYNVYVNEILRREGLLESTREGRTPTLGESKAGLAPDETGGPERRGGEEGDATRSDPEGDDASEDGSLWLRAVSGVAGALQRVGIAPGDVYALARRGGVEGLLRRALPAGAAGALARHVDWANSRAYCRSGPELGVRINLRGREPAGVVAPEAYEAVRRDVIDVLASAHTPDGKRAFDWVRPREAVYDGPRVEAAPDVCFEPAGMNNVVATNLLDREYVPIDKHNHKRDGVLVCAGPDVAADADRAIDRCSLEDVTPVALALAGLPVPERTTGRVPDGLLSVPVERRAYRDVEYGTASGEGAGDAVESRLEELGYL